MTVFVSGTLASVAFANSPATTMNVGATVCTNLTVADANNATSALRWDAATSNSSVVSIQPGTSLPQVHCFVAKGAGTAVITGSFGGGTVAATITVK
jgi:hypothetical protein